MNITASRPRRSGRRAGALAATLALMLGAAACTSPGASGAGSTGGGDPQSGGAITVLLDAGFSGGWPTGLDPATSSSVGANMGQNSAIFGGLFRIEAAEDGSDAEVVPDQAESYEYSEDGLTLTVTLREGIEFSDGTPLDARAVLWNWIRALSSGSVSAPRLSLDLERETPELEQAFLDELFAALPEDVDRDLVMQRLGAIVAVDDRTLEIHLAAVNGALVNSLPGTNMNFIASPTAYAELGAEEFAEKPVAAGPFVVVKNSLSDRLELERNPNYFKEGQPYLDGLTFQSVAGDQVAYQTLQSGQGDAIEGLSSVTLIGQAQGNPDVTVTPGAPTSPYVVQLNTRKPPFDDRRAREAIYYATDFGAINEGLFNGEGDMSQSFTASGGLFWEPEVAGYREYDPEKAAELVDELGGLTVELGTTDIVTARSVTTALQQQWGEAGIDVAIEAKPLGDVITKFTSGDWESMLQTAGAWEPAAGIGVDVRFGSTSPYSGTPLPEGASTSADALERGLRTELDDVLASAVATIDQDERRVRYQEAAKIISDEAYGPFGMAFSPAQVARAGVHGPGLTTPIPALAVNTAVLYDEVWVEQ
ncbi:ABC transporter substrate-binding protein [Leucobacter allii]|uniref:ABC transporter substrate-binding protein n=1 Tax=Leucobacter allii TaxID=2932247 RepID=A0ABY4FM37_9MICO|nr:ABC transporter substrate-binding protein [Leucobacter allii]UOQ57356.1 ABC transporter substrate-binding protein [Leucobacter allii]UOR01804.1 ABC transporter substrate-binding protein [Leucobacter allii]